MSSPLVGPPEIKESYTIPSKPTTPSGPSDPFMDAMVSSFNKSAKITNNSSPRRGRTENGADTYLSAGNPCLDFFFHVVPDSSKESIEESLVKAWDHDPLTTLKLICNLRGVRGTGKSDKEGFYKAALWLHGSHPKTLACNLDSLSNFGYFKDFPEILYRILQGHEIRETQKSEWNQRKTGTRRRPTRDAPYSNRGRGGRGSGDVRRKKKPAATRELRIANAAKRNMVEKERASIDRKDKKIVLGMQAFTRYAHDPDYRFLHERVSDLFSDYLRKDIEFLTCGETNKISLAAKWCPSLDSSFDKATLICESIAKKLFPRESNPDYEGIEEAHYCYRVRDRLRKQVLVPLRKTLQLPEVYMGASDWESLPYNRVASVAMKSYKEIFLKHDEERFQKYLDDAKAGKTTIAAGAVLPHEIIGDLNGGDGGQVAELQWKRMVDDMREKGSLTNCIAISDVSGSMAGTPMEVAVALGLLVSELSEDPWRGKLITFSANPEMHLVEGDDLKTKTEFVRRMDWGMNTDFQKVFDLILRVAVEVKLKPEEMIKRVFVFSDMEFDQASGSGSGSGSRGPPRFHQQYRRGYYNGSDSETESEEEYKAESGWETNYETIVRKFKEKGYGESVPEIVFWNLRASKSTPVTSNQKGVALVSGFSKNLIKMFLDNDGEIDPMTIMEAAISKEEYQKLVVID
ncbi:hypothetical protein AALP_AA8G130400 [Arabis alpina]|uniref:DUF2828 domain-containing protein n=1 Tax=Arabis alpina TaxID=50452 RepID=A0A087G6Q6_ARAAL|nr:hypothetical protein AALP_AA8G130400 [Arabis alpina]